jgi:arylsulfatase
LEHQPGHLIDAMATVVEATGAAYPTQFNGNAIQPMAGVSLLPAFAGMPLERKEPIFFEHEGNRAVRAGKWKLVLKHLGPWELYDMEADRTERRNLVDDQPEIADDLIAKWEAWAKRADVGPWPGPERADWGDVPPARRRANAGANAAPR